MTIKSSIFGTICLRALGLWGIVHGVFTIIGGPERWAGPTFDILRHAPGAPYSWALVLIVAGFLVLYASGRGIDYSLQVKLPASKSVTINYKQIKNAGLWLMAFWCLLFAICVVVAVLLNPTIALTGWTRDILICFLCVMMTYASEPRYGRIDATPL
jgi:hypothetical protein